MVSRNENKRGRSCKITKKVSKVSKTISRYLFKKDTFFSSFDAFDDDFTSLTISNSIYYIRYPKYPS